MASRPIWKRLKYKNIAATLAVILVFILAISAACSDKSDDKSDKNNDKNSILSTNDSDKDSSKSDNSSDDDNNSENTGGSSETLSKNYKYVSISNEENLHLGNLILINNDYAYTGGKPSDLASSFDYMTNSEDVKIMSIKDNTVEAKKTVLERLNSMLSDFYKDTKITDIMLVSGYRTEEYQKELYDADLESTGLDYSTKVEIPGHSEHHSGYALDFQLDQEGYPWFTGEGDYNWINENCYKYGFIQRYQDEKSEITYISGESWHYRYVGIPHAQIIYQNNICLEEYITSLKQYSRENPLYINDYAGTRYAVYYVAASNDDSTNVDIPLHDNDKPYRCSISGNNCDGYIVTVDISAGEVDE